MTTTRSYQDRCGIARALDVIGERWALLIVRELLLGSKRFSELRGGLPRVTPAVLTDRLRELEDAGILRHRASGSSNRTDLYQLTERGHELEPVLLALGRWGSAQPPAPDSTMSIDAHALALRTLFSEQDAAGYELTVALEIEGEMLWACVSNARFEIQRGRTPSPDVTVALDRASLRDLLWGGRDLETALGSGAVQASGDLEAARVFLGLFPRI